MKTIKNIVAGILIGFVFVSASACGSSASDDSGSANQGDWQLTEEMMQKGGEIDTGTLELHFGKLLSVTAHDDNTVSVKAQIEPSYSNQATIDQNYINVYYLITKNGFDICDEIEYTAVSEMDNGDIGNVIHFYAGKDVFDAINDGKAIDAMIADYTDTTFVLPSLLTE